MSLRVKICGITRRADAEAALGSGADAIGFVFHPESKRYIDIQAAREITAGLPPFGLRVGVFVEPTFEAVIEAAKAIHLDTIQLHGSEPPEIADDLRAEGLRVWKAVRVSSLESLKVYEDYPCDALVLDAFDPSRPGGTGQTFDWNLLVGWNPTVPWILSGGLNAENLGEALQLLSPCGVDVSSGVESSPGLKDHDLLRAFLQRAKQELVPA